MNTDKKQALSVHLKAIRRMLIISVAAVAVRWILDHLPQSAVIAGMKSPAQAEANAVALTFRLTQDEVAALEAVSGEA